jgi:hypothetical protein
MTHIENQSLKPLMPFYVEYLHKGLVAHSAKQNIFDGTIKEKYAHDICARVHEIDNALESLSLSIEYLEKAEFGNSKYSFSTHHSFHVENFLLRLTSVVDRCYKVAGTSILLKKKTIESMNGNASILEELKSYSLEAVQAINKIKKVVGPLRKLRNEVAHNASYSNKNLTSLSWMVNNNDPKLLQQFDNIMTIEQLKSVIITDTLSLLKPTIDKLNINVNLLIQSLSFIYQDIVEIDGVS